MEKQAILFPPAMDWSWMKQRAHQMARHMAAIGYTVFFCNRTRKEGGGIEELEPKLYLIHHFEEWLEKELPEIRNKFIWGVWCINPVWAELLQKLQLDWILYDAADDLAEWVVYEERIIRIADIATCSSLKLQDMLKRRYPELPVHLLRNAYDPSMMLHHRIPLTNSPLKVPPHKPWVCYTGAWAPWVDELLLRKLAASFDAFLIIAGAEFKRRIPMFHEPNIYYLGHLPHHHLADYIRSCSVCIIPFRLTPVTLAANPVKAYEYLAAGKPVVSTPLPECELMKPWVDTAATHDSFITKVADHLKRAVDPSAAMARRDYTLSQTWEHRAWDAHHLINRVIFGGNLQ